MVATGISLRWKRLVIAGYMIEGKGIEKGETEIVGS